MDVKKAPLSGDQDRGPTLNAVSWTLAVLSLGVCSARVFSRLRLTRNIWWDDWFVLMTLALTFAFTITRTVYAHNGGCRHVFYLSEASQELALKVNWISQVFTVLAIATGKVSVVFLILRLGPRDRLRRWLLYIAAGSISFLEVFECIIIFAQCQPTRALWTAGMADQCWPPEVGTDIAIVDSSYSAFLDLALPGIAISMIWTLQLSARKKINLSLIMSAGVIACIAAVIKITHLTGESARKDFTWNTVDLFIWNAVEINAVIIAACVPTLRPIYLVVFSKPGAEFYHPKRSKPSFRLTSSGRDTSTELDKTISEPQQAFVGDGAGIPRGMEVDSLEGIRHTVDIDVSYQDRKYPSSNESKMVHANSVV